MLDVEERVEREPPKFRRDFPILIRGSPQAPDARYWIWRRPDRRQQHNTHLKGRKEIHEFGILKKICEYLKDCRA